MRPTGRERQQRVPLYTAAQRARRDASGWTLVQGILAPTQFLVFLISLWLVVSYLMTGDGYAIATGSVVVNHSSDHHEWFRAAPELIGDNLELDR